MKVVLLADVKGQGKKGELVNVSDGFDVTFCSLRNWRWKQAPKYLIS